MAAHSPDTSVTLLEKARHLSDHAAWERLLAVYSSLVQVWLRSAGLQAADRDDLSQRVMQVLVQRLPEFTHNGKTGAFRAWLRSITTNLLREFWRREPTSESASVLDELADPTSSLSRLWDMEHDRHILRELLDQVQSEFSSTAWQAFRRVAIDAASARTVAAELGTTVNAVLIAKSRIINRLRREAGALLG